jgi:hypothetical protein
MILVMGVGVGGLGLALWNGNKCKIVARRFEQTILFASSRHREENNIKIYLK